MNGVYQPYGEMRKTALELAIESAALHSVEAMDTDSVVTRAESYFLFLMEDA